ncbi:hypothetical protein JRO89_XS10G0055300 [Xanthoceras sorbifolium]|uniref:Uncharacterized protein n=1 Tax=Xanthoceras sorbifolium TaxID=99658 RepID=A0ABQ8HHR8_9ROSI|nr:hypothetical protein JRO89_XS10G0055300 [Xanthoceras sorbifolium]
MASMAMAAASLLPISTTNLTKNATPSGRRSGAMVVVAKASSGGENPSLEMEGNEESNGRRELVFLELQWLLAPLQKQPWLMSPNQEHQKLRRSMLLFVSQCLQLRSVAGENLSTFPCVNDFSFEI